MALIETNINFSGKDGKILLARPIQESIWIKNDYAIIAEGGKSNLSMHTLRSIQDVLTARNCDFTPSNVMTLNQRTMAMCSFQLDQEFCYDEILGTYYELYLPDGTENDAYINVRELATAISNEMIKTAIRDLDRITLFGDTVGGVGSLALCDGWFTQWNADGSVIDVIGATVTTPALAYAQVKGLYDALPDEITCNDAFTPIIFISCPAFRLYKEYLSTLPGNTYSDFISPKEGIYDNARVIAVPYLTPDFGFASIKENLWIGRDRTSDLNNLHICDLGNTVCIEKIRAKMVFKSGFSYGFGDLISYYHA